MFGGQKPAWKAGKETKVMRAITKAKEGTLQKTRCRRDVVVNKKATPTNQKGLGLRLLKLMEAQQKQTRM